MGQKEKQEKVELLKALRELESRKSKAPLLFYKRHIGQNRFHDAGKEYRCRVALAGNRWGKTHCGSMEAVGFSQGYRFWEVPELRLNAESWIPHRSEIPEEYWIRRPDGIPIDVPNKGMCVTGLSMARGVGQIMWPKIKSQLPPVALQSKAVRPYMATGHAPSHIDFPNGSTLFFGSAEQDRLKFEGFDAHWAWVDEPVPVWLLNGLWRGLADHLGSIWFTLTPLGVNAMWLKEWMMKETVWVHKGKQRENTFLSSEVFDEFEQGGQYTESERKARVEGEFELSGNMVFKTLEPEVHFIEPFDIPPHWVIGQTVDPHHRKAAFVLWWAFDPATEPNIVFHFFREWPQEDYFKLEGGGLSPTDYAVLFRSTEGSRPALLRICDPRFGKAEWMPAGSPVRTVWIEEMAKTGLHYDANVHGVGRLETGHTRITDMLRYDHNWPVGPTNTPRIFIHKSCPNTMKAMENYAYIDVRDVERGIVEKVSEEFKDPVDCVRYTALYAMPMIRPGNWAGEQFTEEELEQWNE